jgi:plastocyanin
MFGHRRVMSAAFAATLALTSVSAVAAQDDASPAPMASDASPAPMESMAGATVQVAGVDYAFQGLPDSIPAGTTLTFHNEGTEVHEMVIGRLTDEVTPLEELMAMPSEETAGLFQPLGYLFAFPGGTADGSIRLDQPGRYLALCNVHQGSDPAAFEALGVDPTTFDPETVDPSTLPQDVQDLLATIDANPAHMELGMIQEFLVTPTDGELDAAADADASPVASEPAA